MTDCRLSRLQSICLCLFLAVSLSAVVACCAVRLLDVKDKDYAEGHLAAAVERMRQQPISSDWLVGPQYTLNCYGPVYHWVVRAIAPFVPCDHSLIPGRLVSFLAMLATAAVIAMVVGRGARSVELGVISALVYVVSPVVWEWGIRYRVDALAVFFSVCAYWAVDLNATGRRNLAISAAFVVLGSLVKPTAALSAAPIFAHFLIHKRYKDAWIYASLVCGLGAISWLVLDRLTGGYFSSTVLGDNLLPMVLSTAPKNIHSFLCTPIGVAASLVIAWLLVKEPSKAAGSLYCLGFAMNLAIAGALSSRIGSASNYFLETSALGAVVVVLYGLSPLWSAQPRRAGVVAVLLTFALLRHTVGYFQNHGDHLRHPAPNSCEIAELLDTPPGGYVLADGHCIDVVLHAGRRPLVNDPLMFSYLVAKGTLEPTKIVNAMERREVKNLVLRYPIQWHRNRVGYGRFWPEEIINAMERLYVLDAVKGDNLIYKTKPSSSQFGQNKPQKAPALRAGAAFGGKTEVICPRTQSRGFWLVKLRTTETQKNGF